MQQAHSNLRRAFEFSDGGPFAKAALSHVEATSGTLPPSLGQSAMPASTPSKSCQHCAAMLLGDTETAADGPPRLEGAAAGAVAVVVVVVVVVRALAALEAPCEGLPEESLVERAAAAFLAVGARAWDCLAFELEWDPLLGLGTLAAFEPDCECECELERKSLTTSAATAGPEAV